MKKIRIAIFASGTGSNAMNLIRYFKKHDAIEVGFVMSNRESAPIVESARAEGVPVMTLSNEDASHSELLIHLCESNDIDWIVLAGYLRLIPDGLIHKYHKRIINLHPSLLPKYGGKGMYGQHVHKAVVENGEKESGITIHYVNEEFDKGEVIAQFTCPVEPGDTAADVDKKIRELEQRYLPEVVEQTIIDNTNNHD